MNLHTRKKTNLSKYKKNALPGLLLISNLFIYISATHTFQRNPNAAVRRKKPSQNLNLSTPSKKKYYSKLLCLLLNTQQSNLLQVKVMNLTKYRYLHK